MSSKQSNNIIAFMGVAGANADLACRQAEPYMETLACPSFEDVFAAVAEGKARLGMIPIENSQAGRVAEIHNILPRVDVHVVGEYIQPIEHCLVAIKGATVEGITDIYSHPQALLQCRNTLREHGVEMHPFSNTAQAAKDVAAWADPTKAALATPLAAELYGLEILKEHMQDADDNTTVFVIISQEPYAPAAGEAHILTSLLFQARNIPGALYKALGGFATNGVNVLKLESYIPGGRSASSNNASQFFLTFEGNPEEPPVQRALEELGFFCNKTRVLGVYAADKSRYESNG